MKSASAPKLMPPMVSRSKSSADGALSLGSLYGTKSGLELQHHLRAKFVVTWWTGDAMVCCGDSR